MVDTASYDEPVAGSLSATVSVIIPTYERAPETEACLRTLLAQSRLPEEILVVDDSPSDSIAGVVDSLQSEVPDGVSLRFMHAPDRPSLTRARNAGIDATSGDIVVFFDSDSLVREDFLERAVADLAAHPEAMAVRGLVDDPPFSWLYNTYRRVFRQSVVGGKTISIGFPPTFTKYPTTIDGIVPSESMRGCNMVIRREAFETVRFDGQMERYSFFEDIDIALALRRAFGECILADGDLVISHPRSKGGRIGTGDLFYMEFLHRHYLSHKYHDVGPWKRFLLWYCDMGSLVMKSRKNPIRFLRLRRVYKQIKARLRRHHDEMVAGDLSGLNAYFSFMRSHDGPASSGGASPPPPALDSSDMQRPGTD